MTRIACFLALLVSLHLACCSGDAEVVLCEEPCAKGKRCEPQSGLCIDAPDTTIETANISPVFDARLVDGLWQVSLYDRLGGRFLYGTQAPGGEFSWQAVTHSPVDPTLTPQMVLLLNDNKPWLLLEQDPGSLVVATRGESGWTITELISFPGRLSHLHAETGKDFGTHLCAGLEDGSVIHASSQDNPPFQPANLTELGQSVTARPPCTTTIIGGTPTVLSAGQPMGLLSASWTADEGWTQTLLDETSDVISMAHHLVDAGLIVAYLDATSGNLKYATNSAGKVEIQVADEGVLEVDQPVLWPPSVRMASFPLVSSAYMSFYHQTSQSVKTMELQENNSWALIDQTPDDHLVFPALAVTAAGEPALLFVRFTPAGTLDLGQFSPPP
jgi:hypothetical protein